MPHEVLDRRATFSSTCPIFDIPQLQNLDFNGWNVADRIALLISSIIHSGQNLSDYNIVDPAAKNPAGSYEVRVIDYELLIKGYAGQISIESLMRLL